MASVNAIHDFFNSHREELKTIIRGIPNPLYYTPDLLPDDFQHLLNFVEFVNSNYDRALDALAIFEGPCKDHDPCGYGGLDNVHFFQFCEFVILQRPVLNIDDPQFFDCLKLFVRIVDWDRHHSDFIDCTLNRVHRGDPNQYDTDTEEN